MESEKKINRRAALHLFSKILPIILKLCLMLRHSYYSQHISPSPKPSTTIWGESLPVQPSPAPLYGGSLFPCNQAQHHYMGGVSSRATKPSTTIWGESLPVQPSPAPLYGGSLFPCNQAQHHYMGGVSSRATKPSTTIWGESLPVQPSPAPLYGGSLFPCNQAQHCMGVSSLATLQSLSSQHCMHGDGIYVAGYIIRHVHMHVCTSLQLPPLTQDRPVSHRGRLLESPGKAGLYLRPLVEGTSA